MSVAVSANHVYKMLSVLLKLFPLTVCNLRHGYISDSGIISGPVFKNVLPHRQSNCTAWILLVLPSLHLPSYHFISSPASCSTRWSNTQVAYLRPVYGHSVCLWNLWHGCNLWLFLLSHTKHITVFQSFLYILFYQFNISLDIRLQNLYPI